MISLVVYKWSKKHPITLWQSDEDSTVFSILFWFQMNLLNIFIHLTFTEYLLCALYSSRYLEYSSVQFSSVAQLCLSLCDPMNRSTSQSQPCPSPTPGVHPNSCPSSRWCHPAISSSVVPFSSCPQSLPASRSFPMSQLFAWGGQSIGVSASASVLPMNTQDWSPLGDGLVGSPCSPRDSQESFPTPQFKSINFLVLSFLHSPNLTSIHDHWKNHSLDEIDLCWQSNVSAF